MELKEALKDFADLMQPVDHIGGAEKVLKQLKVIQDQLRPLYDEFIKVRDSSNSLEAYNWMEKLDSDKKSFFLANMYGLQSLLKNVGKLSVEIPAFEAMWQTALEEVEIGENLRQAVDGLIDRKKGIQRQIEPIKEEWKVIALQQGNDIANEWLYSHPSYGNIVRFAFRDINNIDKEIEQKRIIALEEQRQLNLQLVDQRKKSYLDNIEVIKVFFFHPLRKKRMCNSFLRLRSFNALNESLDELFPELSYELAWNANIIRDEDEFIISLDEHFEAVKETPSLKASVFTLQLEFDGEKVYVKEGDCCESFSSSEEVKQESVRSGQWSEAEKTRLEEGLRRHKNDLKCVATVVKTRSNKQVSDFLKRHPAFDKKRRRSPTLDSSRSKKLAKWLENSSDVASRLATERFSDDESSLDETLY